MRYQLQNLRCLHSIKNCRISGVFIELYVIIGSVAPGRRSSVSGGVAGEEIECEDRLARKLKLLKKPLRKLLREQGNLESKVNLLREELADAQNDVDKDPFNHDLREIEATYLKAFYDALCDEER
ncbi:hypothetical protein L2E82_15076 [Cichorium intybus]|uniref:Uncharacterized protein n=1 Tax=Cichorium intybus TaxID=13427 RepID=A0ACB9F1U5_CICIN|nr:hypothetical protein L2E82_15076 [Cichorium intybus]